MWICRALLMLTLISIGSTQVSAADVVKSQFDEAIETIATSTDQAAVTAAAAQLRQGGLPAIRSLVRHLDDQRRVPSNYLNRAVIGKVVLGDHVFWLIQDNLETHSSKPDRDYSPLRRENVAAWLVAREGMSLAELRREACIGAFGNILNTGKAHPTFDTGPVLTSYAKRLVELDKAVQEESKK